MNTLTANIQREWLARIINRSKTIEYRDATQYWCNRLDRVGPPPFQLRLINGMKSDSPEAMVLVDKVIINVLNVQICFHIADVLSTTRWDPGWHSKYPPLPSEQPFDPAPLLQQQIEPTKITVEAPPKVIDSVQSPGTHQFSLPHDEKMLLLLYDQGADPFTIRLSAPNSAVEVVVYEILYEPFECTVTFSVITP